MSEAHRSTDRKSADATIAALADLFPETFIRERWRPHRPLKIGIDRDLVEAGILSAQEAGAILSLYVRRYQYQIAVSRGGPRHDLNGQVCGQVSTQQRDGALANVVRHETIAAERLREATARYRAARVEPAKERAAPTPKRRLGLADLRRLGHERKEAIAQGAAP